MTATAFAPNLGATTTEALVDDPIHGRRPLLRGRLHQAAFVASIPLGVLLVSAARADARLAVAVYAVTWTLMFGTSATYHVIAQTPAARFWLRRADHSAIFVHIAGANTALLVLALPGRIALPLVAAVWVGAGFGVADKMTNLDGAHHGVSWLYPLLGSAPVLATPGLVARIGLVAVVLLLATLALYGIGAVCFSMKRPDPIPTVFGYHEVWHVFTVLAGASQLALTFLVSVG
ncbi:MAG: hemolysin III family protein [Actinomycetota bacterium]